MAYSEKVLDHYENPRNVGQLDENSKNVGTGMVGAPACGTLCVYKFGSMIKVLLKMLNSRPTGVGQPLHQVLF